MKPLKRFAIVALVTSFGAMPFARAAQQCDIDAIEWEHAISASDVAQSLILAGRKPVTDQISVNTDAGQFGPAYILFDLPHFKDPVILGMPTVPGNAGILDAVALQLLVESAPEVFVLDWFQFAALFALPAVGFPLGHPLGHAFANVNAVREELDETGAFQFAESLHDGAQFHAIVGSV